MARTSELLPVTAQIFQGNSDIHVELVLGHLTREGKKPYFLTPHRTLILFFKKNLPRERGSRGSGQMYTYG